MQLLPNLSKLPRGWWWTYKNYVRITNKRSTNTKREFLLHIFSATVCNKLTDSMLFIHFIPQFQLTCLKAVSPHATYTACGLTSTKRDGTERTYMIKKSVNKTYKHTSSCLSFDLTQAKHKLSLQHWCQVNYNPSTFLENPGKSRKILRATNMPINDDGKLLISSKNPVLHCKSKSAE